MKTDFIKKVELKIYLHEAGNALARAMICCSNKKMELKLHTMTHKVSKLCKEIEKELNT